MAAILTATEFLTSATPFRTEHGDGVSDCEALAGAHKTVIKTEFPTAAPAASGIPDLIADQPWMQTAP